MESKIIEELEEYKKYTIELITCLEKEDYDSLEGFLNKRQQILDEISNLDYTKEEVSKAVKDLGILVHSKKLIRLMAEKKNKVKQEMNKMTQSKNANNMYNKMEQGARIFSKKI